jgi:hypothetical protein
MSPRDRVIEPLQEPAHASTVGRSDPTTPDFTSLAVQPVSGDLCSMLTTSIRMLIPGPPQAPRVPNPRGHGPRLN